MSAMYREEVPLYGDLIRIVSDINKVILDQTQDSQSLALKVGGADLSRLDVERHGAIRLGTEKELATVRRIFEVLGLHPVGYYDLSEAGLPMHATCFRPTSQAALDVNPFRVFTSVLRPELIVDERARQLTLELLERRNIFSDVLLSLLDVAEGQQGRLTIEQSDVFVTEALKTFQWQGTTIATADEYAYLKAEHPILADVACFGTAHINHLTPRTLDITASQEAMESEGLQVKDRIEGPPLRSCPILLRQTSFLAVEEKVRFLLEPPSSSKEESERALDDLQQQKKGGRRSSDSLHRARFGEIEERGAAVTRSGRELYDKLMHDVMVKAEKGRRELSAASPGRCVLPRTQYESILSKVFDEFPDDWSEMRKRGLIHFTYRCAAGNNGEFSASAASELDKLRKGESSEAPGSDKPGIKLERLIDTGVLEAMPTTYEDFLPLSAAGIFQSNLNGEGALGESRGNPDWKGMEAALHRRLLDSDDLYRAMERESLDNCSKQLGIRIL